MTITKMIKVGLDLTSSSRGHISGWERSTINLFELLRKYPDDEIEIVGFTNYNYRGKSEKYINYGKDILRMILPQELEYEFDLVHSNTLIPMNINCKRSWTLHDNLLLGGHREYRKKSAYIWEYLGRLKSSNIDGIITFSNTVKSELAEQNIPLSKISLVTPIVRKLKAEPFKPATLDYTEGQRSFAVIVGSIERRKNPVYASLIAIEAGLTPVVVGKFKNLEKSDFPSECIFLEDCDDANLVWLYQNAKILLSTSEYEGVNMPIIEASYENLPVAYSSIPIHLELYGASNALPNGKSQAVSKINEIIRNGEILDVSRFKDEAKIAQEYYNAFRKINNN